MTAVHMGFTTLKKEAVLPVSVHVLAITAIPSVAAVSALPILLERCVTNVHQITGAITLSVAASPVSAASLEP